LLKPGDPVQVDVSQVPKEHRDDARDALENALKETGYQPAPNASLVLQVIPEKERFEERTYTINQVNSFGITTSKNGERQEKYRFRVQSADVRLLKDGKDIWDKRIQVTHSAPISVTATGTESVADKLAAFSYSDYGLLKRLELPKFLQEHLGRGVTRMGLGHSVVGPDGLDEAFLRLEGTKEKLEEMQKARAKRSK
jgi:hypothetical protein